MSDRVQEEHSSILFADISTRRIWYLDWPLYLILVVSSFIHFYLIQTTELDADQANLFQIAHDTVAHGLIPLSSNLASINILNPPLFEYILLPAAALSNNPLGGAITVSLFSVAAAALIYFFTRRYFGVLPAIVAALLGTTAFNPLKYARSIWQPNILPFFLILFLFAIFRGAVDRKKGWFFPAAVLIAIIYQLHPSSIVALSVLIVLTVVIAPGTLRWWEIALAIAGAVLLFLPYLVLELVNHFADLTGTLAFTHLPSHNDMDAFFRYQSLLEPYSGFHPNWMHLLYLVLQVLFFAGVIIALARLFLPRQHVQLAEESDLYAKITFGKADALLRRWNAFRWNPERVAFFLLLAWQIIPFATLIHHAVALHLQYFLLFLPGPFIFIGLSLDALIALTRRFIPRVQVITNVVVVLACGLLVGGQLSSSTAYLGRMVPGQFPDRSAQSLPYVNDLGSVWNATQRADQLAQENHVSRLFISIDDNNIRPVMTYMGEIIKTPTTVFGYTSCLVLPAPGAGPAIYLVGPYADKTVALLRQFASVSLIGEPQRLGLKPFRLYLVKPLALAQAPIPIRNFSNGLGLLDSTPQIMVGSNGTT
ncbi:MAG TPA: glycosyltransferase family 39 protein, partial [Ktedonobacteraceae bacterium]|nr:glycosyltransferase family 39 protein [Ktedonobacteraceae bacterium]